MTLTSYDLAGPDPNPMTRAEVDALKSLMAELLPAPVVIQIGAERGCSTLAMLEERPDCWILSVDMGDRHEEFINLRKARLDWRRVVRVLGKSQELGQDDGGAVFWAAAQYQDQEHADMWHAMPRTRHTYEWRPDLLYIDGDHRRPGIDLDIELYAPLVQPGGIIALHDYLSPDERANAGRVVHGRVWEAVNEWQEKQPLEQVLKVERLIAFRKG